MAEKPKERVSFARRARRVVIDLLLFGILLIALSAWTERGMLPANGDPAPAISLLRLDGELIALDQLDGAALVHFWATWCGVCSKQHGGLSRLADNLPEGTSLVTVAVNSGTPAEIQAYAEEHNLSFPILVDDGSAAEAFGVRVFPSDFYLNPSHEVVGKDAGYAPVWAMGQRLRAAR
jgi:peroxiredoxin